MCIGPAHDGTLSVAPAPPGCSVTVRPSRTHVMPSVPERYDARLAPGTSEGARRVPGEPTTLWFAQAVAEPEDPWVPVLVWLVVGLVALLLLAAVLAVRYRGQVVRGTAAPAPARPAPDPPPAPTPARTPPVADGVFISYRRQDEPNFAGRLYDRLVGRFGRSSVFMDVDSIELGLDFTQVIDRFLAQCQVVVVVIGRNWLDVQDARGRRRLDDPNDFVRLEIESALRREVRVIPILVEGAQVPDATALPPTLEPLARRNGVEMSHARFGSDTDRLIDTLDRILGRGTR